MLGFFMGFWDTWLNGLKVSFDGPNKKIIINKGENQINVGRDLYSAWKIWAMFSETQNMNYPHAFRTFGGDPTLDGQFAPQYFFLMNGWKVEVREEHVTFAANLYSDGGGSPFIQVDGGTVANQTADVPVISVDRGNNFSLEEVWAYSNRTLTSTGDTAVDLEQIQLKLDILQAALEAATVETVDIEDTKIMVTDAEHRVKYQGANLVFNKPTDP